METLQNLKVQMIFLALLDLGLHGLNVLSEEKIVLLVSKYVFTTLIPVFYTIIRLQVISRDKTRS